MAHYSPSLNVCFVHVPKTAGVSITKGLTQGIPDLVQVQKIRDRNKLPRNGWSDNHYTVPQIIETFDHLGIERKGMTYFGVIRNPWHRMVSLFKHRLRKQKYNTPEDSKLLAEGFKPWLLGTQHRADKILTVKPQLEWFDNAPIKSVVMFEQLSDDWISTVVDKSVTLGRHNTGSGQTDYMSYYDKQTYDFVARNFAKDIEWGGYT